MAPYDLVGYGTSTHCPVTFLDMEEPVNEYAVMCNNLHKLSHNNQTAHCVDVRMIFSTTLACRATTASRYWCCWRGP
jgi:hypothetical protein